MSANKPKKIQSEVARKPAFRAEGPKPGEKKARAATAGTAKPVRKAGKAGPRKKTAAGPAKTTSRAKKERTA